ncbi:MAG TPA: ATP-binding protein [Vicinamibacterales bacterium]|nr:ATP-binding protein [Vicinamibacterales bacterium]
MAEARPFADVPPTVRGHLGLLFYEAALAVVACAAARAERSGHGVASVFDTFPSLHQYVAEVRRRLPDGTDWTTAGARLRERIDEWERESGIETPIAALGRVAGITRDARLLLLIVALVEEDAAFAALFATLQAPLGHRRPTHGLLREAMRFAPSGDDQDAWSLVQPLVDAGAVDVMNADAPRSEWLLRIPTAIWTAMRGERPARPMPGLAYSAPDEVPAIDDLFIVDAQRDRLRHVRHLLTQTPARTVVVRGTPGSERFELVRALAASLGRGVVDATAAASPRDEALTRLGVLCTLTRAVPVFCPDLGPSELFTVPRLAGYQGPLAIVLGREGGVSGASDAIAIEAGADPPPIRRRHWASALASYPRADVARIADTFTLSGRYIRQCAPLAIAGAALDGRADVGVRDVRHASRALNRQVLESLATPLDGGGSWPQLVLQGDTESDLRDLERRCRHRERLADAVRGVPGGLTRGVRALFEGPSGTGKTLAARVLAAEVGLDIYRVDLASVINKYIGETEKNLSRILSRAEDLDVVLLLDEGDALLSRRTDVRSSNDRYANLETNYLLQRLESYDGIVIVTTNLGAQIDPAFRRRMDVVARFHLPDAEQRWRLWHLHLPPNHDVEPSTIEEVSVRYALTGGQIRNAALYAALVSIDGDRRVDGRAVVAAIDLEHRKAGASFHARAAAIARDSSEALDRFTGAIS